MPTCQCIIFGMALLLATLVEAHDKNTIVPVDEGVLPKDGIRLRGGRRPCEGRVEVLRDGVWGTVCHAHWNILDADVACKQLGLKRASEALNEAFFGSGRQRIHLAGLKCSGNEERLEECPQSSPSVLGCDHSMDAGVVCEGPLKNLHPVFLGAALLFLPFVYYLLEFMCRELILKKDPRELRRRDKLLKERA